MVLSIQSSYFHWLSKAQYFAFFSVDLFPVIFYILCLFLIFWFVFSRNALNCDVTFTYRKE